MTEHPTRLPMGKNTGTAGDNGTRAGVPPAADAVDDLVDLLVDHTIADHYAKLAESETTT